MVELELALIVVGIFLALAFNFGNGLNDAANSIATVVATRALSPVKAILLASFFNFVGPFLFSTAIAKAIGAGILEAGTLSVSVLCMALVSSVLFVFLASYLGIPISTSHALIGGLVGAGIAASGLSGVLWPNLEAVEATIGYALLGGISVSLLYAAIGFYKREDAKRLFLPGFLTGFACTVPLLMVTGVVKISGIFAIILFITVSPMLGFLSAYLLGLVLMRLFRKANSGKLNSALEKLQIVSACGQAVGHGANDAQNAMGMITALLVASGTLTVFEVPTWVIVASCAAIAGGTLLGGWRVVRKMAYGITHVRPYQGFAASTGGTGVLALMTIFGISVSTTHAIAGAIMGAGTTRGHMAVKWSTVREIVAAWFLTIPSSAFVAYVCYKVFLFVL
ncbi:MAG: inorganic phosphate transporter [Methanomicrobiales archaeon]|jgi:PiT family inorganic phosphate transporter|nr:inorganic phosphate transporter [Methanomicrobiales archaeon]